MGSKGSSRGLRKRPPPPRPWPPKLPRPPLGGIEGALEGYGVNPAVRPRFPEASIGPGRLWPEAAAAAFNLKTSPGEGSPFHEACVNPVAADISGAPSSEGCDEDVSGPGAAVAEEAPTSGGLDSSCDACEVFERGVTVDGGGWQAG
eukprot:RCo011933